MSLQDRDRLREYIDKELIATAHVTKRSLVKQFEHWNKQMIKTVLFTDLVFENGIKLSHIWYRCEKEVEYDWDSIVGRRVKIVCVPRLYVSGTNVGKRKKKGSGAILSVNFGTVDVLEVFPDEIAN